MPIFDCVIMNMRRICVRRVTLYMRKNMKTIGIKLADGTFYPILEEGTAKTYQLDLTTVKDGQTKVQIDLYRSKTNSMEDAEYLDTLEVTNLVPHPNGEAELHLSIGLNENNELDAKIVDEETGEQSQTSVTLVSRTLAERSEPTNFDLMESEEGATEEINTEPDSVENEVFEKEEIAETVEGVPFSFDSEIIEMKLDEGATSQESDKDIFGEDAIVEDLDKESIDSIDDLATEDVSDEENQTVDAVAEGSVDESFSFDDVDFSSDEQKVESTETEDFVAIEEPIFDEENLSTDEVSSTEEVTENFDSSADQELTAEPAITEDLTESSNKSATDDFSLPGIDDEMFDNNSFTSEKSDIQEEPEVTETQDDSLKSLNKTPVEEEFSLPDFDTTALDDSSFSSSTAETNGLSGYFDDPDFKDDPVFTEPNLDTSSDNEIDFNSFTTTAVAATPDMDFSDLYDKDRLEETSYQEDDEEEKEDKTHVPMIVCIICAIICVIATLLVLFIVPSQYNLIKSRNTKETRLEQSMGLTPIQEKIEVVEEPAIEEPAPEAVEDTIIVVQEPEKVVPVPEPAPKVEKQKDIKYRIRWGDTLWDIADAYYKNPWRYPKIAKYNKIKNPDLIISGTDILIPVE